MRMKIAIGITVALLAAAVIALIASPAQGKTTPGSRPLPSKTLPGTQLPDGQLVYICSQVPCADNQELEVFDTYGNPIFSVGEYGGASVFGDNFAVYAPGNVWTPAMTVSYTSPAAYDAAHGIADSCTAPSTWMEPGGVWSCQGSTWVQSEVFG